jgi:adenine-specific DNA-methyltransferase
MHKLTAQDPETKSADIVTGNIEQLKALFPEAFTEGKVDFEVLKQLLGGVAEEREEKFGLNWHGKRSARQLALTPSNGTLRPCPDESVDWDTTQNLMIEGDNLEVLKLLQKSYAGKVKLIYIDPPYNTGKDFVYPDTFQDNIKNYLELTGQLEGGKKISSNTEASGRFHTDWLNMVYPRLKLARNLLREDGLVFVSIDDSEACNLRHIMDDIFGEDHCVAQLVWKNKYNAGALTKGFSSVHEYILCYSKGDISNLTAPLGVEEIAQYRGRDSKYETRGGYVTQPLATSSKDTRVNLRYPIIINNREIWPEKQWIWSKERIDAAIANDEVVVNETDGKISVRVKQYLRDENGDMREMKPLSLLIGPYNQEGTKETKELLGDGVFTFPKPVGLIRQLVSLTINDQKDKDALILDFFSGSGTTAQAVLELNKSDGGNRRFIIVQFPEPLDSENKDQKAAADFCDKLGKPRNISELTKERLRRVGIKLTEDVAQDPELTTNANGDLFGAQVQTGITNREKILQNTGFRVFKLDTSNINTWDPDRDDLEQTLLDHLDHIKLGRSEADILYELLLKLGLDLCVPIEERLIAGKAVHSIGAGALLACLTEKISRDEVEALALGMIEWHKKLSPASDTTCVFRDSAFADDVAKSNLAAILEQHGIKTVRSL